jgi:hypothetical protein
VTEANVLRGGTEEHVSTAAETTVSKARTARTSEKDSPMAETNALRGGTEEHVPTAAETTVSKAWTAQTPEEDSPMAEVNALRGGTRCQRQQPRGESELASPQR